MKYSPSSPQLDFYTYNCGHCVFMCYVLWVTSSSSCIYTRWIWAASSASNTAELQLSLLASFTYNNIQNHSPLPNIHTQTIHAMLNSISFRAHLCTSGWVYIMVFVCRTEGMGEVPPEKMKMFCASQGYRGGWGYFGSRPNQLYQTYCWGLLFSAFSCF